MDEFQKQMYDVFAFETNSFLGQIETILMQAEQNDGDITEAVPEIFRIMHTIKSSSAMMGFEAMSKLCHSMEDLFHYIRDEHPEHMDKKNLTDLVLNYADYVKRNMKPEANEDPEKMLKEVAAYLSGLKNNKEEATPQPQQDAGAAPVLEDVEKLTVIFVPDCKMISIRAFEIMNKVSKIAPGTVFIPGEDDANGDAVLASAGMQIIFKKTADKAELLRITSASPFVIKVIDEATPPTASAQPVAAAPAPPAPQERRRDSSRGGTNMISVQTEKLDDIVNIAGELIIASMGAEHTLGSGNAEKMAQSLEALHNMILSMQDKVLELRMVSLKDLFHQMHRLVRAAAGQLGREIRFQMSGEDTALDKKIIESMVSPLQHLLRNAVDHGVEDSEERIAAGKDAEGLISISAEVDGGHAILTVSDDGHGLNRFAIINKAVQVGLVTQAQAQGMTDEAVYRLILLPGFSTNTEITELSGRGVGMDVVNEAVRKLNGQINIQSTVGHGTTFILQLPLTLTVAKVLLLMAGDRMTAIPMAAVVEVFAADSGMISSVNGVDTVLFADKPYTVISAEKKFSAPVTPYDQGVMLLLGCGGVRFALYVTKVIEEKSVVVKPVPKLFSGMDGLYGTTILGDGSVCLILDALGLYKSFLKEANQ